MGLHFVEHFNVFILKSFVFDNKFPGKRNFQVMFSKVKIQFFERKFPRGVNSFPLYERRINYIVRILKHYNSLRTF